MSTATSGSIEIPFLGEWGRLRRERRELRERLAKLEYEQGRYSESVLARVRIDYERRINDLESRAGDLAERARREVDSLSGAVEQQENEIRASRLGLEEFELREKLGESLDDESASRAAAGRQELARLEDDLRAMRELLERVRAIAEGRTGTAQSGSLPAPTSRMIVHPPANEASAPLAVVAAPPMPPVRTAPPPPPVTIIQVPPPPPPVPETFPPYPATGAHEVFAVPRLIPIESSDSADHFALRPKTVIGRTAECDLRLPVGTVSRRHAEIEWADGGWKIHDLQSENGTWVNGDRTFDRVLVDGDRLQFGTVCLVFKTS